MTSQSTNSPQRVCNALQSPCDMLSWYEDPYMIIPSFSICLSISLSMNKDDRGVCGKSFWGKESRGKPGVCWLKKEGSREEAGSLSTIQKGGGDLLQREETPPAESTIEQRHEMCTYTWIWRLLRKNELGRITAFNSGIYFLNSFAFIVGYIKN